METEQKLKEAKNKIDRKLADIEYKRLVEISVPKLQKDPRINARLKY